MEAIRQLFETFITSPGRLELIMILLRIIRVLTLLFGGLVLGEVVFEGTATDIWGREKHLTKSWIFIIVGCVGALLCLAVLILSLFH